MLALVAATVQLLARGAEAQDKRVAGAAEAYTETIARHFVHHLEPFARA